jgi:hypothetical protein
MRLGEFQEVETIRQIIKLGAYYFALVFATGFLAGTIRTLWLVPHVGVRAAELMEMPIMLVVIVFAARWAVRRLPLRSTKAVQLGLGLVALGLTLIAEFTLLQWHRGLTLREYLAGRDPVAGSAYLIMLAVFALMPLVVARKESYR